MALSNFERMIQLVTEVFDAKNDPGQISVTDKDREKLEQIHKATMSEVNYGEGPVAWLLIIPTTIELMNKFVSGAITELELLDLTPPNVPYNAIYLCSASVLEEYRSKGIAKETVIKAIESIRKDNDIKALFVWPFSTEGDLLAEALSKSLGLPLYKREFHL